MSQITSLSQGGGGGAGTVITLTSNVGGAVSADGAGNINTLGDGLYIEGTGNPGANTITFASTGIVKNNYTAVNATPYVVLATDQFIGVDSTAMPITIELPDAPAVGRTFTVKDSMSTAAGNNITVTTVSGAVTLDGAVTFVMNSNYEAINVLFDGATYQIF